MNVAVVTPRYPPVSTGGGERSAKLLAENLAETERIDSVTVLAFDGDGTHETNGVLVDRQGTVSSTVTEWQNLRVWPILRSRLSEFDIVHSYNMELHPVVGAITNRQDIPSVATLNSYQFFPSSVSNTTPNPGERVYELVGHPTTGRVLRHYVKRIDVFVALSKAIQRIYEQNGFANCRFEHVPNMIDPTFDAPDSTSTHRGTYRLLYVGSLAENKGVSYLVRAVSQLPERYSLQIVGDGPKKLDLKELASELNVAGRIEFSGRIPYDRIDEVYANADAFVHPGIWPEPLNRTLLEAMQAGLPVVCTDIGGPPEVIPVSKQLCEPADSNSLAAAISRVSRTEIDLGRINREHINSNYNPGQIISRIVNVYELLMSERTPN
ncbi:glycosyltransferase family 4 protein [Halapricum desulfuricans]|uniref:Glycosyltransferase n=1 Tax=Halapricum desulfuricans TaxID=2841257 RepID=A0A897N2S3_9EURY|nr:glycosyltransferase family 4 protein [Halapricum desulfuricans]QSG06954.1 Glycosyltransferase [Halapricum desulfuricans]